MKRLFNFIAGVLILLVLCLSFPGCPSFRIERANDGAEIKPPPAAFIPGKTTLADVLEKYGAPVGITEMEGYFSLYYQRGFYRGASFSFGIPLSDVLVGPSFGAIGNLRSYDSATFVFTSQGILSDISCQFDIGQSPWKSFRQ